MLWLSKHPKWQQARIVDVSTRSFGLNSPAVAIRGDEDEDYDGRKLCYLPSFARTYSLWYQRHYLSVTRTESQDGIYHMKEVLQIDILARDHKVLNNLLLEAKHAYHAAEEHLISIYVSETSGNWRHVTSRPKRPLKSIVLDPGMKDLLLDDARDFLQSKEWYSERGIPFRRGYLLYGAPGSGKTSMIHSLAGELGLDVYIVSLSRMGLDDTSLSALISELPERCIALMEDIDAAFHHGLTRDLEEENNVSDGSSEEKGHEKEKEKAAISSPLSRITLSGLLNALDGVGAQEGRILYATTNRYTALDPALCRPGRMDLHVEFKLSSRYQARELFKCFYLPSGGSDDKDNREDATKRKTSVSDSADASSSSTPSESDADVTSEKLAQSFVGHKHRSQGPQLSRKQAEVLADRFADLIPERELSMASLQGYLMSYKVRPVEAVENVSAWVEKERAERAKKNKRPSNS
ncbi:hypothetical protein PHLCEN_2v7479 [Hermanssonia centrifuga]|uniref:P-loop containing nucleoside triphosphate hydrolase protein n=1 Tax=Hermanssonia centrifuga TaxID=98765 RepID=A0A2R6NWG7_9APHY|nr:hypothetical protein PHLCEN_2v7479 [Hermanssonia centrifuga]